MLSVIKLFNLFVASVSLCLLFCPISGWEVGKLPVASPHDVVSISTTSRQTHSGILIIKYPCDEAQSLTQELLSVWVSLFQHLYDSVSSSSAPSSEVPDFFGQGFIYGDIIFKILDSDDVRDAVFAFVIWCLCAAALVGFVCWVRPPARRHSRYFMGRGSSGFNRGSYRPSLWRRMMPRLRQHMVPVLFVKAFWPFQVSFGTFLFNLIKPVGSSAASLLHLAVKPTTDLSHRLGHLLLRPAATPEEAVRGLFVSLCLAPIFCCFFIWMFSALFLRTSDVKRPTGECLVILHTRNKTSVILDGHEQSCYGQSVIPREKFKHSKDHHETPGETPLLDAEYSSDESETKTDGGIPHQPVQNVSRETETLQELLPTGRSLQKQPSTSTTESVKTSQDLVTKQQPSQENESNATAVSEQKPVLSVGSESSTPMSFGDPEVCDGTLLSQTSSSVTEAVVSEPKSSQLFSESESSHNSKSGISTSSLQPHLEAEVCDRSSKDKLETIVSELKLSQLNGSEKEKEPQTPLEEEIVSVTTNLNSAQPNGSGSPVPSQTPSDTLTHGEPALQKLSSQHNKSETSILEEKTTRFKRSGPLATLQPSPELNIPGRSLPHQQPQQIVGNGSSVPRPSHQKTHERTVLLEQPSSVTGCQGSLQQSTKPTTSKASPRFKGPSQIQQSAKPITSDVSKPSQQNGRTHIRPSVKPIPSQVSKRTQQSHWYNGHAQESLLHAHSSPPKELRESGVYLSLQKNLQRNASIRPVLAHQPQIPTGSGGFPSSQTLNKRPELTQLKPKPIGITFRESIPLYAMQNKGYGRINQEYFQSKRQLNSSLQNKGDMAQQNDPLEQTTPKSKGLEHPELLQTPQTHGAEGIASLTQSSVPGRSLPMQQSVRPIASEGSIPLPQISSCPIGRNERSMPVKESPGPYGAEKSMQAQQTMKSNCTNLKIQILQTPPGPLLPMKPRWLFRMSSWVRPIQRSPQNTAIGMLTPVQSTEQPVGPGVIDPLTNSSELGKITPPQPHSQCNVPSQVQQSGGPITYPWSGPTQVQQSTKPIPPEVSKPTKQPPQCNESAQVQQADKPTPNEGSKPTQPSSPTNGPKQVQQSPKPMSSEASPLYKGPTQNQHSAKLITSEVSKPPQQPPLYNGPTHTQQSAKPIPSDASKSPQQPPLYNGASQTEQSVKLVPSEVSKPPQQPPLYNGPTQMQQSAKPTPSEVSKPSQQPRLYNGPIPMQQSAKPIPNEVSKPPQQPPLYDGTGLTQNSTEQKPFEVSKPSQQPPLHNGPTQMQQSAKPTPSEVSKPSQQPPLYNGASQTKQSAKLIPSDVSKPSQQPPLYNGPTQTQQSAEPIPTEVSKPPQQPPLYNGASQTQNSTEQKTFEVSKPSQQPPLYNGPTQLQQFTKPKPSEEVSKPPQQPPLYNRPTQIQRSAKPIQSEVSKPSQQSTRCNGPTQLQQSAEPVTYEVSKPPQQSHWFYGTSQLQQSSKPIPSEEVSKPPKQPPLYNGPTQLQQSAETITSEVSQPPQQSHWFYGPTQLQQFSKPIPYVEVSKPPKQPPLYNGPTQLQQSAETITYEVSQPPQQSHWFYGPTQLQQSSKPIPSEEVSKPPQQSHWFYGPTQTQQSTKPIPSEVSSSPLSVSSPAIGPGKSRPEQQIIESNNSRSTPFLQTQAPLVPMKPGLLFKRSEWAKSIQQQTQRVSLQTIPSKTQNDMTPQPQPDPCSKSVTLLQTPKPNEAATPELLEATQLQQVGPGGHTKELTTTIPEECPMSQPAKTEGTKPTVAQDKPIGMMGEERPSVSFADGDSLLMTAFIVQNSSLRNVRDSVILPKCCKTKPKSSPTPKGILVIDKSRRRRSSPRPWVEMPPFSPCPAEKVRAMRAVEDAKTAREHGLAAERKHAAQMRVAPVYNERLQISAGLTICTFETE
ncbi:uncharacterized protein [Asterias amurensis]|uniref:uncharacterized protein n=1 Tax=Asterias amurensis TaxID=7602 RepID=UPI003AB840D0